jgi:Mg2+/Co2+ transporter CorB
MTIILGLLILFMVALSGFLSATETAITASTPGKIHKLAKKKSAPVLKILKVKDKVISTLLIGNTLVNTICVTIATGLFIDLLGDAHLGTIVSSAVMSFLVIVFAEVIPKAIAVSKAETIAILTAPTITFFLKVLMPINILLDMFVKVFCAIFRINLKQEVSGAEEVRGIIEHHLHEGNVYKTDSDMLGGILDIRVMTVSEIMIHKNDVDSIDINLPQEDIISTALASDYSRIPMWQNNKDNIIGILHIRNLAKAMHKAEHNIKIINIRDLIMEPWFIPEDALAVQQLHEFRSRKKHLACVVDEYGEFKGIVTLEDILEEIVGPIEDEHDHDQIIKKSATEFIMDGTTTIRDINREFNWELPDEKANTIAGLIINEIKRIPNHGEKLNIFNLKIKILKKLGNRIETVKVTVLPTN